MSEQITLTGAVSGASLAPSALAARAEGRGYSVLVAEVVFLAIQVGVASMVLVAAAMFAVHAAHIEGAPEHPDLHETLVEPRHYLLPVYPAALIVERL